MAAHLDPAVAGAMRKVFEAGIYDTLEVRKRLWSMGMMISDKAIRRHKARYLAEKKSSPSPKSESVASTVDATVEQISRTRDLRRERNELLAVAGEKSLRSHLEQLVREVAPQFKPLAPCPLAKQASGTSHETMLTKWSDWHAFETVTLERTMGLNQFNAHELGARVRRDVETRIHIKRMLEKGCGWSIRRHVIACNGDFVSGTIHDLERHNDGLNVVQTVWSVGLMMAAAIRDMAPHFEVTDVYCTSGNHGRFPDAKKKQLKDPSRTWDTLVYLFAMEACRQIPNVRFHIPDSFFAIYEIEGRKFLQTHGDAIKSWNQIPYYGIDRLVRNIQALFVKRKERVDYFLLGHFHSASIVPTSVGEAIVNGSLIGGNEFSIGELGKSDVPSQWLLMVHPDVGVTSRWPIFGASDKPVEPYQLPVWPVAG